MTKWMVSAKKADFNQWARRFQISPITARLVRNRGIVSIEEAEAFFAENKGHDPALLQGAKKAVECLLSARKQEEHIRIIGDYDVDGICSSYIFQYGLSFVGCHTDVRLPLRVRDGYGLNESMLRDAMAEGIQTILTCDNGIAAIKEVAFAKARGMRVVVTDHHEPVQTDGEEILPEADAVVDPKQRACAYPFDGICGAVVAYRVLQLLFQVDLAAGTASYTRAQADVVLEELTAFCAIATVCDVMPLTDENRSIVKRGLRQLQVLPNEGMRALLRETHLEGVPLGAYHLGFVIGPCLNAAGRLDSAERALELFTETNPQRAKETAAFIKALNDERKELTEVATRKIKRRLAAENKEQELPKIIVSYLPDCHESVAGIVAGRLKEQLHRPTIVLTRAVSPDGEQLVKGSARSIDAYDMHAGLSACASLFLKFGGHKMAAGMTLKEADIEVLRQCLNEKAVLTEDDFEPIYHIDMEVPFSVWNLELVKEFALLEPFGIGNSKPLFVTRQVRVCEERRFGQEGKYARFLLEDESGNRQWVTCFHNPDGLSAHVKEQPNVPVHIVYEADINVFRGTESVQLLLKDYRCAG